MIVIMSIKGWTISAYGIEECKVGVRVWERCERMKVNVVHSNSHLNQNSPSKTQFKKDFLGLSQFRLLILSQIVGDNTICSINLHAYCRPTDHLRRPNWDLGDPP